MRKSVLLTITTFFLALPVVSFAVDGSFLVPSWQSPSPSQAYAFGVHVVANGTWQLPPDWVGNIYVYKDATIDPVSGAITSAGTQAVDVNNGKGYYDISNAGGAVNKSGLWSFDIGAQTDGAHNVYITFWGGKVCAVNAALNASTGSSFTPTCPITADNAAFNLVWPDRVYSVGLPAYPRMVITPSTDPAFNYANTVVGSPVTKTFYITNTGQGSLTGSISGLPANFTCTSCSYVVNPGDGATAHPVNLTYAPTTAPSSFDVNINFSCSNTSPVAGCEGGAPNVTVYQSRHIIGSGVTNSVAPAISLSPGSVNYGQVNLGVPVGDVGIVVTNSGGGILSGGLTFSLAEYSCTGTCTYSLNSGQSTTIYVHYDPVSVGTHNDSAVFSGGGGQTISLQSVVNDKPIAEVYYGGRDFSTVNVGSCGYRYEYLRNRGAGTLIGDATLPVGPFSCVANCSYSLTNADSWLQVTLQYCPTTNIGDSETAQFTNTTNPGAGASTFLIGNGNVLPIGAFIGDNYIWFGSVLVGNTAYGTITITNSGVGILNGAVGTLPAGYACISNCTYVIPANTSVNISFSFTPTLVQSYNGSVVLSGVGPLYLYGSGVKPDFGLSWESWPWLGAAGCGGLYSSSCLPSSPKTFDIGTTNFGGSGGIQNKTFYLYIMNRGSGANANYSFSNTAHFICMGGAYFNGSCTGSLTSNGVGGYYERIAYQFQPSAPGDYSEPLVIDYDYGDGVPRTLTLVLEGHSVSAPYLSVSPNATIALGNVSVGQTVKATFLVTNLGTGALDYDVSIPASPGYGVGAFTCINSATNFCSATGLLQNQSRNVEFLFTPTTAAYYAIYPLFTSNGGIVGYPADPTLIVTGVGVLDPIIQLNPSTLGFPDTNQGLATRKTITIKNTGLGTLVGNIAEVKAAGLDFYCVLNCSYNVPAGGSIISTIEFAPNSTGPLSARLTINSNAANGQQFLDVFGNGVFAPIIDIRGSDTNYGPVVIGRHKDQTFTISNSGSVDLGSGTFTITGPFVCVDPVDITDGLCHYNITAGSSIDIKVRFSPTAIGPASGAVWLSGVPLARFFVSGTGVAPAVKFIEK